MGFDLYGLNPENPNKAVKPEQIDWSKKPTEKEKSAYFDAVDDFQIEVVGSYFRANVWYWRPIWSFVCGACNDILTENDMERGSFNDGHKISKTKAKRIATKLRKNLKNGHIHELCDRYEKNRSMLKLANKDDKKLSSTFSYPMNTENFEEFQRFCENSGGFEIW